MPGAHTQTCPSSVVCSSALVTCRAQWSSQLSDGFKFLRCFKSLTAAEKVSLLESISTFTYAASSVWRHGPQTQCSQDCLQPAGKGCCPAERVQRCYLCSIYDQSHCAYMRVHIFGWALLNPGLTNILEGNLDVTPCDPSICQYQGNICV